MSVFLSASVLATLSLYSVNEMPTDKIPAPLPQSVEFVLAPQITVTRKDIERVNATDLRIFLGELPHLSTGSYADFFGRTSSAAGLEFYGLPVKSTLVLVNGKRFLSSDPNRPLDLIPPNLIERADIVTGAGSVLYGEGAAAGVLDITLRDATEGLILDYSYEQSSAGDSVVQDASAVWGKTLHEGKVHLQLNGSYSNQEALLAGDRDYSTFDLVDTGDALNPSLSVNVPNSGIFGSFSEPGPGDGLNFSSLGYQPTLSGCLTPSGQLEARLSADCFGNATFLQDGMLVPWVFQGPLSERFNYAPLYTSIPEQQRRAFMGAVTYEPSPGLTLGLEAYHSSISQYQQISTAPFFEDFTLDPTLLTPEQFSLFSTHTDFPDLFISGRVSELGPRKQISDVHFDRISAFAEGQFTDNWRWGLAGNYDHMKENRRITGFFSRDSLVDAVANGGCQVFGTNRFSSGCLEHIARQADSINEMNSWQIGAHTEGQILKISAPWTDKKLSLRAGVEYRENSTDYRPSSQTDTSEAWLRFVPFVTDRLNGEFFISEYFMYGALPLIDSPDGTNELLLFARYRHSDHSTAGDFDSYGVGLVWEPTADLQFRAQAQRSGVAPSIPDVFDENDRRFPGISDPCARPEAANDPVLFEGCVASGLDPEAVGFAVVNAQVSADFGANPDLPMENWNSFTATVNHTDFIFDDLMVELNYSLISVENAHTQPDGQQLVSGCVYQLEVSLCDRLTREGTRLANVDATLVPLGEYRSSTIDVKLDYHRQFADNELQLSYLASLPLQQEHRQLPWYNLIDCHKSYGHSVSQSRFGAEESFCGQPSAKYQHTAIAEFITGKTTISGRWRHIDESRDIRTKFDPDSLSLGQPFISKLANVNYFDFGITQTLTPRWKLKAGIKNAFDQTPPLIDERGARYDLNTYPGTYDLIGRRYFLGIQSSY